MKTLHHVPIRFDQRCLRVVLNRSPVIIFRSVALSLCIGVISAQEEPPGESLAGLDVKTIQEFDNLDRNRSGGLDRLEFAFSEVAQRAREHGDREMVDRLHQQIDKNSDGEIRLPELVQSQHNRNARILDRANSGKYLKFDANEDGLIGLEEYLKTPNAKPDVFEAIDLNGSGKVGPVEWVQALRKIFSDQETALAFTLLDANDDGIIDGEEFKKLNQLDPLAGGFAGVDLNGNREIGAHEFAKARSAPAGAVPPEIVAEFEKMDRNKDHAVSRREFSRGNFATKVARKERRVDEVFARLDRNTDGEVSLGEFVAYKTRPGAKKRD